VHMENEKWYMVKKEEGSMAYIFLVSHKWTMQADSKRERERERERECYVSICVSSFTYGMVEVVFQCSDTAFGASGIVA